MRKLQPDGKGKLVLMLLETVKGFRAQSREVRVRVLSAVLKGRAVLVLLWRQQVWGEGIEGTMQVELNDRSNCSGRGGQARPWGNTTWQDKHLVIGRFNVRKVHQKGLWASLLEELGNRKEWREGGTSDWYLLGLCKERAIWVLSPAGQREKETGTSYTTPS